MMMSSNTSTRLVVIQMALCSGLTMLASVWSVAEAVAQVERQPAGEFPRQHFLRTLASSRSDTRLEAIERLQREFADDPRAALALIDVLERIRVSPKQQAAAVQLVRLLRHFPLAETSPYLIELLGAPDLQIVMSALDILAERKDANAIPSVLALGERPEFASAHGFRIAVLEAVIALQKPECIDFLVRRLPDLHGQSLALAVAHLAEISGESLGNNPGAWRAWWDSVDQSQSPPLKRGLAQDRPDQAASSLRPAFFGIEIHAQRLLFVIDKSKSMNESLHLLPVAGDAPPANGGPETKLARAQRELIQAIARLPAETHFDIIAFDGRIVRWQPRLALATDENKAAAARFVMSVAADGQTAWFDALHEALQIDSNLEAVFFLSDGVPTVGRIVSAPEIVQAVTEENYFRRVSIHTIGLGVSRTAERFLRRLGERNRGAYQSIGRGEAALAAEVRQKAGGANFEPRRVIPQAMPPIVKPRVQPADVADQRLKKDELVLGVVIDGQARAYPLNMLTGPNREIVNDELAGQPIAATWCHLAHCATVYSRQQGDQTLTLAVSGMLWNDTLVMTDTGTRSLWGQLTGKAMRGPLQGKELQRLAATVAPWQTWLELHPDTTVLLLSRTAHVFDGRDFDPLFDYVAGAASGPAARAWPLDQLLHEPVVNDSLGDEPIVVVFQSKSKTVSLYSRRLEGRELSFDWDEGKLIDRESHSVWNPASGQAIAGPRRGSSLTPVPAVVAYREAWEAFFPGSSYFARE